MIRSARLRLGEAPRTIDPSDRYLRVRGSALALWRSSERKAAYRQFEPLLKQGRVVWASLVVAQNELFSRGTQDGWAVAVYSPRLHVHDNLDGLVEASQATDKLRQRRGLTPNELSLKKRIGKVGSWFAPEALPESINPKQDLKVCSLHVFRKHLPRAKLSSGWLPILADPGIAGVAILPERYWTPSMRDAWIGQ